MVCNEREICRSGGMPRPGSITLPESTVPVELQETKDAIPAEEERIFADLRKKAG